MTPAISVLMTVYNPGRFLAPAVESVLAQSCGDFELIAVENGSSDGSRDVLRHFASIDRRVRLVELEHNIGRTPALILALEQAQGALVAVEDADDLSMPTRFERQKAYLEAHPDCVAVGSWCRLIDTDDRAVGCFHPPCDPEQAYQTLPGANVIAHSAVLFRRQSALAVGGYPAEYPFAQDYGLWVRLARVGAIANLPEELAWLRQHATNMSTLPEHAVIRSRDAARIFREAASLPGLSRAALRASRRAEALESGRLARELLRAGRPLPALGWGLRGLLRSPGDFLGKLAAGAAA